MEKFITKNRSLIIVILLLTVIFYIYNNNNSVSEIYKLNTDCTKIGLAFAKDQSDEFNSWKVEQSLFKREKASCFAEFSTSSYYGHTINYSHYIYDLSHAKELTFSVNFEKGMDTEFYLQQAKDYQKIKTDIFGKEK